MTAASDLAPVRVRCERFLPSGYADWETTCWLCGDRYLCGDWEACMEHAIGHLAFSHPGWWKRHCEHGFAAHTTSKSWCLDCGADLRTD